MAIEQTNSLNLLLMQTAFTNALFLKAPYNAYKSFSNETVESHTSTAIGVVEPSNLILTIDNYFSSTFDSFKPLALLL